MLKTSFCYTVQQILSFIPDVLMLLNLRKASKSKTVGFNSSKTSLSGVKM